MLPCNQMLKHHSYVYELLVETFLLILPLQLSHLPYTNLYYINLSLWYLILLDHVYVFNFSIQKLSRSFGLFTPLYIRQSPELPNPLNPSRLTLGIKMSIQPLTNHSSLSNFYGMTFLTSYHIKYRTPSDSSINAVFIVGPTSNGTLKFSPLNNKTANLSSLLTTLYHFPDSLLCAV